jgi:exosome complex exonuclease RRP6
MALDQYLGRNKAPAIAVNEAKASKVAKPPASKQKSKLDPVVQHASHLTKPQMAFKVKPDNFSDAPWLPTLRHKYHAQVPLGFVFDECGADVGPVFQCVFNLPICLSSSMINSFRTHPYQYEIQHLKYPSHMFQHADPVPPKSFEETAFTWVDEPCAFAQMLDRLKQAREIAVDLEHHDYRSFGGFVCLMQISTREQDWIVDTLVLRDELEELGEVFADPNIVKVSCQF